MRKRELFEELMKGIEEMAAHRERRFEKGSNQTDASLIADINTCEVGEPETMLHTLTSDDS